MTRAIRLVLAGLFLTVTTGAVGFAVSPAAGAQADGTQSGGTQADGRVLIISAPRLTWSRFDAVRPPHLTDLFTRSAVAMCSTRTATSLTRPGDVYLTLGAGNRMETVGDGDGVVVARTEAIPEGDPTAVFRRNTGVDPDEPIIAMGKPSIDVVNRQDQFFGAEAGSLGGALDGTGRNMAVIANADRQFGVPRFRHAGLAAMRTDGQIHRGMVSSELLRADEDAAFGLETDPEVFDSVFEDAWANDDVVLVELSDLERAEAARASATVAQGDRQYDQALRSGDDLVGRMLDRVDLSRDTVIVVGVNPPVDENQLTVFAMAGPGIDAGWATSGSTRRDSYVALTDIAPTVIGRFGIEMPDSVTDTPLSSSANDESLATRVATMVDRSHRAVVRDEAFGPTTVVFIVVLVVDIVLAVLCLARLPRLVRLVRGLALVVLAVPPVTFLLGTVSIDTSAKLGAAIAGGALLAALGASLTRRIDPALPPIVLLALLWSVLAADIATGGRLQINTIFGYSPVVAGRFAGFGNQAFSMIALSSLLLASVAVERRRGGGRSLGAAATVGVGVWFLLTVVLDGHPSMGSDVGGVLAFVPAATVALLMFRDVRVRPRLMAAIAGGTVAVLAAFAGLDLSRPSDERTHLGRFVAKLFDGDAGEIIQRKIAANLRVLTSVWAWVIPVALLYFMYLTWRPNHTLQRLNREHTQFRSFGVAALTLGVLSMALNDSGVSLPGIMLALVAAFVSFHVVDLDATPEAAAE